jgi:signal peptidase II
VADFFHFYALGYDWYVFNVADIAITLGAVAIIYEVLKPEHPHPG